MRGLVNIRDLRRPINESLQLCAADLLVAQLRPPKYDIDPYFMALLEKFEGILQLETDVVFAGIRAHPNILQPRLLGLFGCLLSLLLLLIAEFAVVHNPADWGIRFRRQFYQIQLSVEGLLPGLLDGHDAQLLAFGVNYPHLWRQNTLVDTISFYGHSPLLANSQVKPLYVVKIIAKPPDCVKVDVVFGACIRIQRSLDRAMVG